MTISKTGKAVTQRVRRVARVPQSQRTNPSSPQKTSPGGAPAWPAQALHDKPQTKTAVILGLLLRRDGANLEQMSAVTGWLPHTTRAALTGLRKQGYEVTSVKVRGVRTYRVVGKLEHHSDGDDAASERQQ